MNDIFFINSRFNSSAWYICQSKRNCL